MQHYLALKTEPSGHEKLWRRLKCTSLSDTRQPEKTKCSELYEILKKASYGDSKNISGCQGSRGRVGGTNRGNMGFLGQ